MQFHLEQYEKNKEQGLAFLRAAATADARYHLLSAAKYLLMAAQKSEPALRDIRARRARRIRDLAMGIGQSTPAAPPNRKGTAEDGDLTPEATWLVSEKPNVRFEQIAGLEEVKEAIRLRVIYPFHHPEAAERFHKRAGGGMLLYGPPGTGKTMIARAVATELDAHFFNVKSSNIMSQWVGVAERNLARLFELARAHPISVVFLDETDALVARRGGNSTVMNRVVPEFLSQVDGLDNNRSCILLMGATNRPWDLDEAALRTGRFGERFYVGLPGAGAREQILHMNLDGIPLEDGSDLHAMAARLDGYSGADIAGVCAKATDFPFQRQIGSGADAIVTRDDLDRAIRTVRPSVNSAMLEKYRRFADQGDI